MLWWCCSIENFCFLVAISLAVKAASRCLHRVVRLNWVTWKINWLKWCSAVDSLTCYCVWVTKINNGNHFVGLSLLRKSCFLRAACFQALQKGILIHSRPKKRKLVQYGNKKKITFYFWRQHEAKICSFFLLIYIDCWI